MWSACTPNLLTLLQSPCAVQCLGEGDQMNFSSSMFSKKQSSCMQMFPCANTCTHAQVHACTCTYIHVCYYTSKPSSSPQQEFNTKSKKEQKKNYYINQNSSGPFSVAHFLYVTEDLGLHPFFTDFFFRIPSHMACRVPVTCKTAGWDGCPDVPVQSLRCKLYTTLPTDRESAPLYPQRFWCTAY